MIRLLPLLFIISCNLNPITKISIEDDKLVRVGSPKRKRVLTKCQYTGFCKSCGFDHDVNKRRCGLGTYDTCFGLRMELREYTTYNITPIKKYYKEDKLFKIEKFKPTEKTRYQVIKREDCYDNKSKI
jgi:hypothetical protein